MFVISVETHFEAEHQLIMADGSKEPLHKHDWQVTTSVSCEKLNSMGLVMDFHHLRAMVESIVAPLRNSRLDEKDCFKGNMSSAENVARFVYEKLESRLESGIKLESIAVVEERGCTAKFTK